MCEVGNIKKLAIAIGTKCNFRCRHCTIFNTDKNRSPRPDEIKTLRSAVRKLAPGRLLFTGGEPTLYIPQIKNIVAAHPELRNCQVVVTTNGHFAGTKEKTRAFLSSLKFVNHIQMSYDKFHAEFVPIANVKNLYEVAREMNKEFSLLFAIESPMDLQLLPTIKKTGNFSVGIQKILPLGEAKNNHTDFQHPGFDSEVLRKKCPNSDTMTYMCGKGFSWCCSELVFCNPHIACSHKTVAEHLASKFYKLISKNSFGSLMRQFSIPKKALLPLHSEECMLCSYIFERAGQQGLLG